MKYLPAILYSFIYILLHLSFCLLIGLGWRGLVIPAITSIFLMTGYWFRQNTKVKNTLLTFSFLYLLLYIGYALIIPAEIYRVWFEHMGSGNEPETISKMLQHIINLFLILEYLLLSSKQERKVRSSLLLASSLVFFFIPGMITLLLCGISLFLSGWIITTKGKSRRIHANPVSFIGILALIPVLLLGFFGEQEISGSSLADALATSGRISISRLFPRFPLISNIPGKGGVYELDSGGRRPILSAKIQFSVTAERGSLLYLKSGSRLHFKNNRWNSLQLPENKKNETAVQNPEISRKILITQRNEYAPELLYTENTFAIEYDDKRYSPDPRRMETLTTETPLFKGSQYTLLESRNRESFIPNESELRILTQVPYEINPRITALAESLRGNNDLETLSNINYYLNENMQYTLDTRKEDDFLSDFLFETRKGFCLHFATAYIILARINGIPSRLGFGYIAKIPLEEPGVPEEYYQDYIESTQGTASVSGYSAHFWPEVFLKNQGWQIREATPPMRILRDESSGYSDNSGDRQTERLIETLNLSSTRNASEKTSANAFEIYSVLFLIIPVLIIIFLIYRSRQNLWNNFRRLSLGKELPDPLYSGWLHWAEESSRKSPENQNRIIRISSRILEKQYSRHQESVRTEIRELKKIISGI